MESFRSDGKWTELPATSICVTTHWICCASTKSRTTTIQPVWQFLGKQLQHQSTHQPYSSYLMSQPTGFQQLQPPQTSGFPQSPSCSRNPQEITLSVKLYLYPSLLEWHYLVSAKYNLRPMGVNLLRVLPGVSTFSSPSSTMPLSASTPSMGASSNKTPARPSSTPFRFYNAPSQPLQLVKSYQTGAKNPFPPISNTPPLVPKVPTLLEFTTGMVPNGNSSKSATS